MKKALIFAAVVMVTLAGCNSGQSGTVTDENGETVHYDIDHQGDESTINVENDEGRFQARMGEDIEATLPTGYSLYPGARIVSHMTGNQDGGSQVLIGLSSPAAPEDLVKFYRGQAEAAGIKISGEVKTAGMQMIGGENEAGDAFSFTVSRGAEEDVSHGQLTVVHKSKS